MTSPSSPPIYTQNDIPAIAPTYALTATELHTLSSFSSAAKSTAYCPYSKFRVGATILTTDGQYISGANVENASYPVGTCAERVALGKAVTDLAMQVGGGGGFKEWKKGKDGVGRGFKALAVATDISPPASPCGMCRQLWVALFFTSIGVLQRRPQSSEGLREAVIVTDLCAV
jgi:cytidine deaminase